MDSREVSGHDAAAVEALAKELQHEYEEGANWTNTSALRAEEWRRAACLVLRREAALVEALEELACLGNGRKHGTSEGNMIACRALAAHRAASAPENLVKEPTLAEAVERVLANWDHESEAWQALKAALAREQARGGGK